MADAPILLIATAGALGLFLVFQLTDVSHDNRADIRQNTVNDVKERYKLKRHTHSANGQLPLYEGELIHNQFDGIGGWY